MATLASSKSGMNEKMSAQKGSGAGKLCYYAGAEYRPAAAFAR